MIRGLVSARSAPAAWRAERRTHRRAARPAPRRAAKALRRPGRRAARRPTGRHHGRRLRPRDPRPRARIGLRPLPHSQPAPRHHTQLRPRPVHRPARSPKPTRAGSAPRQARLAALPSPCGCPYTSTPSHHHTDHAQTAPDGPEGDAVPVLLILAVPGSADGHGKSIKPGGSTMKKCPCQLLLSRRWCGCWPIRCGGT